jgi:DNA-binding NtrC family response regulator
LIQGRVLVIDDEQFITKSLKQYLEKEGFEVSTAATGEDGLELFRSDGADIVILDLNMPGMNGIETLMTMKKLNPESVVIIITAHGDIETAVNAIKAGSYDFVEKPFELSRISILAKKAMETVNLKREVSYFREEKYDTYSFQNIVGESEAMKDQYHTDSW